MAALPRRGDRDFTDGATPTVGAVVVAVAEQEVAAAVEVEVEMGAVAALAVEMEEEGAMRRLPRWEGASVASRFAKQSVIPPGAVVGAVESAAEVAATAERDPEATVELVVLRSNTPPLLPVGMAPTVARGWVTLVSHHEFP